MMTVNSPIYAPLGRPRLMAVVLLGAVLTGGGPAYFHDQLTFRLCINMQIKNNINIFEYVAADEQNFLTTLHNFREEFDIFGAVVDLYQIGDTEIPRKHSVPVQLFAFIHNHLLVSTATLMRCHLSEAAHSVRVAIDAALIAYRIVEGHGTQEDYIEGKNSFDQTPRYIKNKRRDDPNVFPIADHLLRLHALFSKIASHADFDVFLHRLSFEKLDGNREQLQLGLFQFPKDPDEFRMIFLGHLHAFVVMANIFEKLLVSEVKSVPQTWGARLRNLGSHIEVRRDAAKHAFETKKAI
jgi:hypothetical protein